MKKKRHALKQVKQYRDSKLTADMDLTTLSIRAQQEATRPTPEPNPHQTIKPVPTPLDAQIEAHERLQRQQALRQAVGAEAPHESLHIDLSMMKRKPPRSDLKLFDH